MTFRRLRQAPLFTTFAITTLAVGIAIATAAYSFLYSMLWLDPHVRSPSTLVALEQHQAALAYASQFSWPEVADVAAMQTTFDDTAAWRTFSTALAGAGDSRLIAGEAVSGRMFELTGVKAALGRVILSSDDRPDASAVVVLSDTIWRTQFGSNAGVVGTSVRMAGRVFEVIGVAPSGFRGFSMFGTSASVWTPIASAPASSGRLDVTNRELRIFRMIGRLKPGRTLADVKAESLSLARRLDAIAPISTMPGNARVVAAHLAFDNSRTFDALKAGAIFVLSLPALVLLVACTNLANLVLSRGVSRQHEFAVRRALGASRWQLVHGQLAEGAVIAGAGAVLGVWLADRLLTWAAAVTNRVLGALPEMQIQATLEPVVLFAAAGLALLALAVSSLVPALQLTRAGDRRALNADTNVGATPKWRGRSNLIAIQVTVSVALFLMTAFGVTVLAVEMPRDARSGLDRIAVVGVPFGRQQYDETRVRDTLARVLDDARMQPGVERVEVATLPIGVERSPAAAFLASELHPFGSGALTGQLVPAISATPGIFRILGTAVRFGRPFDDRDVAGAPPVAVINQSLALTLFGVKDASGHTLFIRDNSSDRSTSSLTVVGVVEDMVDPSGRITNDRLYVPFAQHFSPNVAILASSSTGDVDALITRIRTTLRQIDPDIAISQSGRADMMMERFGAGIVRMVTGIAASLATIALMLSMTGLYGVLSHVVSRRTRELGLRMALGAGTGRIVLMILKDGSRPILEGLVIGLAVAAIFRMMMQPSFSVQIGAVDLVAFAFAAGPLLVAGAIACYLPARRAASVDPNVALRNL